LIDQHATGQDRRDVTDALVREGDLVAGEDHRNCHDGDRGHVQQAVDVGEETADLLVGAAEVGAGCEHLRGEQCANEDRGHQQGLQRALGLDEVEIGSLHGLISLLMD